jgi:hypothetical protein
LPKRPAARAATYVPRPKGLDGRHRSGVGWPRAGLVTDRPPRVSHSPEPRPRVLGSGLTLHGTARDAADESIEEQRIGNGHRDDANRKTYFFNAIEVCRTFVALCRELDLLSVASVAKTDQDQLAKLQTPAVANVGDTRKVAAAVIKKNLERKSPR